MLTEQENSLISLLWQVKEVLDNYNIEFWLECGTLLGAVRNGKIITWEHDIDLATWQDRVSESVKISISRELSNRGFDVYIAKNWITIKKNEGIWLDISFYSLFNDKAIMPKLEPKNLIGKFLTLFSKTLSVPYYYTIHFKKISLYLIWRNILVAISRLLPLLLRRQIVKIISIIYKKMCSKDVSWVVPAHYFKNLSTVKFYEMEFRIPAKTEEYLTYRYGRDWRIPRKDWITNRDDGAIGNSSF